MKHLPSTLALTLLLAAGPALAQPIDLGPGVSSYTRFLVYPHLQKGFDAMRDGDRARTYGEFQQALALAPQSTVIVLYLADAYRHFGEPEKARALLQDQLAKRPDDAGLKAALAALPPAPKAEAPAPTPAPAPAPAPKKPEAAKPAATKPAAPAPAVATSEPTPGAARVVEPEAPAAPSEPAPAQAEAPAEPQAQAQAEPEPQPEPQIEAQAEPRSEPEPQPVAEAEAQPEPQAATPEEAAPAPVAGAEAVVAPTPEQAQPSQPEPAPTPPVAQQVTPPRVPAPPPAPRTPAERAYAAAETGYKASAGGNHAAAVRAAREAVRLAPQNVDYRRLLAYALLETGDYDEVEAVASAGPSDDSALAGFVEQARQRRAFAEFEAANRALANGELAQAVVQARRGAELAPGNVAQQVQWLGALAAAARWDELEATASQILARPGMEHADIYLLRAHARQRQGRMDEAERDYDRALALVPADNQALRRNAQLIAIDAALAEGNAARAAQLLAQVQEPIDATIQARQRQAQEAQQRSMTPSPWVAPALATPKTICVGSDQAPYCELWPGESPEDPGVSFAADAVRAYGERDFQAAVAHARAAVERAPANPRYQLLYVRALLANGQTEDALEAANRFLDLLGPQPEMLALRSNLHRQLAQPQRAQADAEAALADPRLSVASEIDLLLPSDPERARAVFEAARDTPLMGDLSDTDAAYLAIRVGDDASAAQSFARASEKNELPDHALLDAGYVSGRLGRSDDAVDYFKRAVDAAEAGRLALTPQRLFETRREIADRSRTWGAVASLGYRGVSPGGLVDGSAATIGDSVQAGFELSWRPSGYRDGSYYEVYGGGFHTLWTKGSAPSGGRTTQGMLGVRVKPFSAANLVLAAERRIKIGNLATNDWLLRAGYSFTHGTDLRLDASSWFTAQVYAEVGRFTRAHRNYGTFEADVGRSYRVGDQGSRMVLFPHVVLAADHDSGFARGQRNATGGGLGVAARYWFNEDRYQAPRSYVDVSLQYRARLSGDDRGKGVFLRVTLNY